MVSRGCDSVNGDDWNRRPYILSSQFEHIPEELKLPRQWVGWNYEYRNETWTKVPKDPKNGEKAKTNDASTWGTFEEAVARFRSGEFDGVGFVFTPDDPYFGIDLDDCRDRSTGAIESWAAVIIARFATYSEVSPSGTGVKLIGRGRLPLETTGRRRGSIEAYHHGRYFTLTGHRLPDSPDAISDSNEVLDDWFFETFSRPQPASRDVVTSVAPSDAEIIAKASSSRNGESFLRLWNGDASGYPSQSEADLALCGMLAFFVGPNSEAIDRLFRQSGLVRDKWARDDYRSETIRKAIDGRKDYFDWNRVRSSLRSPEKFDFIQITERVKMKTKSASRSLTGKLTLICHVYVDEKIADIVSVTSSTYGRSEAVKRIIRHTGQDAWESVSDAVSKLLIAADEYVDSREALGQRVETVREIVFREVPNMLNLTHRTSQGLWSEARGGSMTRHDFCSFTPQRLIDLCKDAVNAIPSLSGEINEPALQRRIESALKVLWATLTEKLPVASDGDSLTAHSAAGEEYRRAIEKLWIMLKTHQPMDSSSAGASATFLPRASLASRVLAEIEKLKKSGVMPPARAGWRPVQSGLHAWYRIQIDGDGQIVCLLAMKHTLADQLGIAIPGVSDQKSLRKLGSQFGCIDLSPTAKDRLSDGSQLAVLSEPLTRQVLAQPTEELHAESA